MIDAVLEITAEHLVFGIGHRSGPDRPQPSHQPGNPVGHLNCLIAVAFYMERRLDEMPAPFVPPVHASPGLGDQRRALIMLVENHDKTAARVAFLFTKLVDPLDRLEKHSRVEPVRTVRGWCRGLPEPDVEDEATESFVLVEQPIRELSKLTISSHLGFRLAARSSRMDAIDVRFIQFNASRERAFHVKCRATIA